jgi:hypothetical protein
MESESLEFVGERLKQEVAAAMVAGLGGNGDARRG